MDWDWDTGRITRRRVIWVGRGMMRAGCMVLRAGSTRGRAGSTRGKGTRVGLGRISTRAGSTRGQRGICRRRRCRLFLLLVRGEEGWVSVSVSVWGRRWSG